MADNAKLKPAPRYYGTPAAESSKANYDGQQQAAGNGRQDRTPNVNVNNWAKKVRGSQILQQGALKLATGKVGQTSYTKILQDRFGIVKKFYKQQEGLTDKGMISPMEKSPIRTKTALERS